MYPEQGTSTASTTTDGHPSTKQPQRRPAMRWRNGMDWRDVVWQRPLQDSQTRRRSAETNDDDEGGGGCLSAPAPIENIDGLGLLCLIYIVHL